MIYQLYFYDGKIENEDFRNSLRDEAIYTYLTDSGAEEPFGEIVIEKGEHGKPHVRGNEINGIPVYFNISHSEELWVMMIGPSEVGVDIQKKRHCNFYDISERYFEDMEKAFVNKGGEDAFFKIWVHREALGKLAGDGFFGEKSGLVNMMGNLNGKIDLNGRTAYIKDIEISDEILLSYATYDKDSEYVLRG